MGVIISYGGLGYGGDLANERVHLEVEGYHCVIYCKSPHIQTVHIEKADSGIKQDHAVVGPGY